MSEKFELKHIVLVTTATSKEHLVMARETVLQCLFAVGLIPVVINAGIDTQTVAQLLKVASGIVLTGGPDINPQLYNAQPHPKTIVGDPARDTFELSLLGLTENLDLPILAICRGAQILAVYLGAQLHQEVSEVVPTAVEQHGKDEPVYADLFRAEATHPVVLTNLEQSQIFQPVAVDGQVLIPSMHHQAVIESTLDQTKVLGRSPAGIVEIFSRNNRSFQLAVQGHPEATIAIDGSQSLAYTLFTAFAEAVKNYMRDNSLN